MYNFLWYARGHTWGRNLADNSPPWRLLPDLYFSVENRSQNHCWWLRRCQSDPRMTLPRISTKIFQHHFPTFAFCQTIKLWLYRSATFKNKLCDLYVSPIFCHYPWCLGLQMKDMDGFYLSTDTPWMYHCRIIDFLDNLIFHNVLIWRKFDRNAWNKMDMVTHVYQTSNIYKEGLENIVIFKNMQIGPAL